MRGAAYSQTGLPPMLLHPADVELQLTHRGLSTHYKELAMAEIHSRPTQHSPTCRQP